MLVLTKRFLGQAKLRDVQFYGSLWIFGKTMEWGGDGKLSDRDFYVGLWIFDETMEWGGDVAASLVLGLCHGNVPLVFRKGEN